MRLGVRARLTIFVSVVFTAAAVLGSVFLIDRVEDMLIRDTRANAEALLSDYLALITGGTAAVPVVEPDNATSFFFLDSAGNELTETEYLEKIIVSGEPPAGPSAGGAHSLSGRTDRSEIIAIDPETGLPLAPEGGTVNVAVHVDVAGPAHALTRGDDVIGLVQQVELPDGTRLQIGASSPLRPVTDSLDALRTTLWFVIPLLVAAVAAITWLAAHRALRPVHSITGQTRAITSTNLSQRVPVPQASDDIHDLATTMNEMLARLQRSQDQQRRFIADASHELRSPVAASRTQLEVALGGSESDWPKTATTVLAEQETLTKLIDDLLALGRLDEQGIGPVSEVDLVDLLVAESERPHRNQMTIDIADPVRVIGNQSLLVRALRNLVDNADRHAATEVRLRLGRDDDRAFIHVDDDGPGVPLDQREHVFDRFARADESRQRQEGGAGLGLAIAREIVTGHDGDIECVESPLGGARFTISIPVGSA